MEIFWHFENFENKITISIFLVPESKFTAFDNLKLISLYRLKMCFPCFMLVRLNYFKTNVCNLRKFLNKVAKSSAWIVRRMQFLARNIYGFMYSNLQFTRVPLIWLSAFLYQKILRWIDRKFYDKAGKFIQFIKVCGLKKVCLQKNVQYESPYHKSSDDCGFFGVFSASDSV